MVVAHILDTQAMFRLVLSATDIIDHLLLQGLLLQHAQVVSDQHATNNRLFALAFHAPCR